MDGGHYIECKICGKEITEWETVKIGWESHYIPVGHDNCVPK
jgi:hypothetical protein